MEIQGKPVTTKGNYLDPVTYVPTHADGNAGHKDCEKGVVIRVSDTHVFVLYNIGRNVQATRPEDLVWG